MKCIDCGNDVGNWPDWLEKSNVTVRCARCSKDGTVPINMPREHTVLTPLTDLAKRTDQLAKAA